MQSVEQWFADPDEVLRFGTALVDADEFEKPRDVLEYIEKPWKWDPEHFQWAELGRPHEDAGLMWEKFVRGLASR
jgi:hypothetical protein